MVCFNHLLAMFEHFYVESYCWKDSESFGLKRQQNIYNIIESVNSINMDEPDSL